MSKKKLYGMLAFVLFSFAFLGILITIEFSQHSNWINDKDDTELVMNTTDYEVNTSDDGNTSDYETDTSDDTNTTDDTNSTDDTINDTTNIDDSNAEDTLDSTENVVSNTDESSEQEIDNNLVNTDTSDDTVMIFSGDVWMSDYILNKYNQHGIDGILSESLQKEFAEADIAMLNQEFSFSKRGTPMKDKQYTFRADPKWVQIFTDMQLDIVTLANNHTLDYGTQALVDNFDTLNSSHIQYVGAGNTISEARATRYLKSNDKTIAVLGASRVIPVTDWNASSSRPGLFTTYDPAALIEEIKVAKEQSDYVVVYVHWGIEKESEPEDYQRKLAQQYIDAGADLVVGSHPHVLQGIEYYNDKPIVYSLGNFMFYNSISQTAVLKVILKDDGEIQVQLLPCKAEDALTSDLIDQNEKSEFFRYMKEISFGIEFDENGTILNE